MMKWISGINLDMEYGVEDMLIVEDNEHSKPKFEEYPRNNNFQNFGFMELFAVVMVIPFWIFIYNFFYLLVLPLIPISVVVFELVREVAPLNKLLMFGSSFLAAYLFYRGMKWFLSFFSLGWSVFSLVIFYALAIGLVYTLFEFYPNNDALQGVVLEIQNSVTFLKSKV